MTFDSFVNYETEKLLIENPNEVNLYICLILLFISIITIKKTKSEFLDFNQSNQIKGLAILFVILGHLWVHVSQSKADIILSGNGVAIFLMMSGFGIMVSLRKNKPAIRNFWSKRVKKIFVPYWAATTLILFLDFILLQKKYHLADLIMTFLGININSATRHIDYARWFITFIIFWYFIIILIAIINQNKRLLILYLISIPLVVFFTNYYVTHLGWYQIFSFPIGCFIGLFIEPISKFYKRHINFTAILSVILLFASIRLGDSYFSTFFKSHMPYVGYLFFEEINSVVFSLSIIFIIVYLGEKKVKSRFLYFTGIISYELFLVHGIFLIKYNFFITKGFEYIKFVLYLISVSLISFLLMKSNQVIQKQLQNS